jgi:predicted nucleic acid-binding protein
MRLIVADAGPLIALSRIGRLAILADLFDDVVIPSVVLQELRLEEPRPGVEQLTKAFRQENRIRSMTAQDQRPIPGLDDGEAAAIRLSAELKCPLLIDERRGRTAARHHGLQVVGTGRLLLWAKESGLIVSVRGGLDELRSAGYRLSDPLYRRLLELAEE